MINNSSCNNCNTPKTTDMMISLVMILSLISMLSPCSGYEHVKEIMKDKKMILSWSVDGDILMFKMSCLTSGYIGLVFSHGHKRQEGFIAGMNRKGAYHKYLAGNDTGM